MKKTILATLIMAMSLPGLSAFGAYSESPNTMGFELKPGIGTEGLESALVFYTYNFADYLDVKIGLSDTLSSINSLECHDVALNFEMDWKPLNLKNGPVYTSLFLGYGIADSTGSDLDEVDIQRFGHGFNTGSSLGLGTTLGRFHLYAGGQARLSSWKYTLTGYESDGSSYSTLSVDRQLTGGPEAGLIYTQDEFSLNFKTVVLFNDESDWIVYPTIRIGL